MDMAHIIVDFNDRDEDGTYAVLIEHAPGAFPGQKIAVQDDEGCSYKAHIVDVDTTRGLVRLDMGFEPRLESRSATVGANA